MVDPDEEDPDEEDPDEEDPDEEELVLEVLSLLPQRFAVVPECHPPMVSPPSNCHECSSTKPRCS